MEMWAEVPVLLSLGKLLALFPPKYFVLLERRPAAGDDLQVKASPVAE